MKTITTRSYVKDILDITDTTKDNLIDSMITMVEEDFLKIRGIAFELNDDDEVIYPANAPFICARMIGFLLEKRKKNSGVKNESIGSFSYTNDDKIEGYPKDIVGQIDRYIGAK